MQLFSREALGIRVLGGYLFGNHNFLFWLLFYLFDLLFRLLGRRRAFHLLRVLFYWDEALFYDHTPVLLCRLTHLSLG